MLYNEALPRFEQYLRSKELSEKTIYGYLKDLEAFQRYYEAKSNCQCYVEDVRADDLDRYIAWLQLKGLKPTSRNRIIYALRGLYKFLRQKGICDVDISQQVETVRVRHRERVYLTEEEAHAIIGAMDKPLHRVVTETLFYAGLRISECLNLRVRNVDFENRLIRVIRGKGGKDRNVPMNDKLYASLWAHKQANLPEAEPFQPFFATESTGQLCASYYNTYLTRVVEGKLGWTKRVTAHTFRHSFASSLVKKDVNLVHIQKLLGHSSLSVTSVYTHASMEDLASSVNAL